ncbi:hypothetical protein M9H77_03985 [Catharanthus roseus]|uniref:Uncharacterized protein n=1 Tax=Catharanthus roseus TaxID=4058 RepID=A0ACC0CD10_CATRO|nr:hypothetical protein M9H77_03985 [Catharanthus roseus]
MQERFTKPYYLDKGPTRCLRYVVGTVSEEMPMGPGITHRQDETCMEGQVLRTKLFASGIGMRAKGRESGSTQIYYRGSLRASTWRSSRSIKRGIRRDGMWILSQQSSGAEDDEDDGGCCFQRLRCFRLAHEAGPLRRRFHLPLLFPSIDAPSINIIDPPSL